MRGSLPCTVVPVVALALLAPRPANASPDPGPVWDIGLGLEYVSVSRPDDGGDSGPGARVFIRGSFIGRLMKNRGDRTWIAGDYFHAAAGLWYGEGAHVRIPLGLGLQFGMIVGGDLQVVGRAGIEGIAGQGGDGGGYGTLFLGGRVKYQRYAGELSLAPRRDSGDGSFASLVSLTARLYATDVNYIGLQVSTATRLDNPPDPGDLTDRYALLFWGIER